jgi:hypothetical protein
MRLPALFAVAPAGFAESNVKDADLRAAMDSLGGGGL